MQLQDDKPYDDINITPMLDLAYVLLVIFILMCTTSLEGLRASLPKASKNPPPTKEKPKTKTIAVERNGALMLNGIPVTQAQLEAELMKAKAAGDFPVLIKGDGGASYQGVMSMINLCSRLGLQQPGLTLQAAPK